MSIDTALLTRQRLLAAKIETTTGTPIALSNSDAAMNIFDSKIEPEIPAGDRRGQSALSRIPQVPGARKANVSFKSELHGAGSSGSALWTMFLLASGMSQSGAVYSFASGAASPTTLTVGSYIDGRFKSAAGCVFDWTLTLAAGKPAMFEWTGVGVWQVPSAVSLLTPTYPTVIPPRVAGITLTVGGTSYYVNEIKISAGNTLALRQDATHVSGYHAGIVTDRAPRVTMDPEALPLGTKDWFADHLASTEAALNCVVGGTSNNIFTIAAPKMQLMNPPQEGDRDGIYTDSLEFQCNRSAAAGDDELTITQS